MQTSTLSNPVQDEFADHDDVAGRGRAFYETHLKDTLEASQAGHAIAIHLDTGDYAVAASVGNAMRALRAKHPDGPLFLRRIGSEPEPGLASRLLAASGMKGAASSAPTSCVH